MQSSLIEIRYIKAILMVLLFAFITGAIAATALPPQMAVPELMRCPSLKSNFKILVNSKPSETVKIMENRVKLTPSLLVSSVSLICIPNPSPTTEIFKK